MLNVSYIKAKKEALSFVYLLIIEINIYWSYGDSIALPRTWKCNSSEMEPCFMFTIIFMYKIIVMIDDTFGCKTCLALCLHVNFKWL